MSPLRGPFGRYNTHSATDEPDLEQGCDAVPLAVLPSRADYSSTLTNQLPKSVNMTRERTSMADSEFSELEIPMSPDRYQEALATIDPGSSQTSSSMSTSLQYRAPTPPLLFGRGPTSTDQSLHSIPERADSRLKKAMKEVGLKSQNRLDEAVQNVNKGHVQLTRTNTTGSDNKDWETVSDMKLLGAHNTKTLDETEGTGSSLADYSDSGSIAAGRQGHPRISSIASGRANPFLSSTNYHQAYVLVQDATTGETISVPQVPIDAHNTYHHPVAMSGHRNPFTSSPPELSQNKSMLTPDTDSALTDAFDNMVESYGSHNESKETPEQSSHGANFVKNGHSSSGWISTVSEPESRKDKPAAIRAGSFAKVAVLGWKGNVTGTPEGSNAREVGSSLADSSSPPAPPSSEQPSFEKGSPNSLPLTPNHKPWHHPLTTPRRRLPHTPSFTTPDKLSGGVARDKSSGSSGPFNTRRRSSSESNFQIIPSPLATKTTALKSPDFRGHRQRNTMPGLLSSGNSSFYESNYEDDDTQDRHVSSLRARRGHRSHTSDEQQSRPTSAYTRLPPDPDEISIPQTPTSTPTRAFRRDGVVHTDTPLPVLVHPIYGVERPWDTPERGRLQPRSDRYTRPIARVESPHLHRIPRPPTTAMIQRQRDISRFWLVVFCLVPPVALIYGHGLADEIIRMQTEGEIENFSDGSKKLAFYWGYGGSLAVVAIIFVIAFTCF